MAGKVPLLKARARFKERLFFGFMLPPLRLFCEPCGHYVPSSMEWVCSRCHHENRRTSLNSFLHQCEQCKQAPKSFECPQCKAVNFLTADSDGTHPARTIPPPPVPAREFDLVKLQRELRNEEKEDLKHAVMLARLNAELAQHKAAAEKPTEQGPRERLEKSFAEHQAHLLEAHRIARREKQQNAETYRDDPEFLEMADEAVQAWLESHM